jgi:hypothetical protein
MLLLSKVPDVPSVYNRLSSVVRPYFIKNTSAI